jgi:hypothetical protein
VPAVRLLSFQSAPSEIPSSNMGGGLGWRTKRAAQISRFCSAFLDPVGRAAVPAIDEGQNPKSFSPRARSRERCPTGSDFFPSPCEGEDRR